MFAVGCNDVGPSRYLAEVTRHLDEPFFLVASDLSRKSFLGQRAVEVKFEEMSPDLTDLIITGTTLPSDGNSLDRRMFNFGKRHGIHTVSVVDHWSWIAERFTFGDRLCLPDAILVNDGVAMRAAIDAGLPPSILHPIGNPILEKSLKTSTKTVLSSHVALPNKKRRLLIICERLHDLGLRHCETGRVLDELDYVFFLVSELTPDFDVSLRPHPSEAADKYNFVAERLGATVDFSDRDELIGKFDFFLGFSSMLLVELAAEGARTFSYIPVDNFDFWGVQAGLVQSVEVIASMADAILKTELSENAPLEWAHGSTERIANLLREIRG